MQSPTLLIVDDDPAILALVGRVAERAGFEPVACLGGNAALQCLSDRRPDAAVVDLLMPDIGGLDVIRAIRESHPDCHVALMSGFATIDTAVEAARLGAVDCLTKPLNLARINIMLTALHEQAARRRRVLAAERNPGAQIEFCGMIGRTLVMQRLFALIRRLAPHARTVLVRGETGVGKELVARALHLSGPRRQGRFVALNCNAGPATMYERQIFGYVQGGFPGAREAKPALFEFADGGTVFLDEIGSLPAAAQATLLRILESGEVRRLGALEPVRTDVHVIAATNRDMEAEVAARRFRADLFYRLNAVQLTVPPLRQRREDIPFLTAAFIREVSARMGKRLIGTTAAAERQLLDARWAGNVRELRNAIERACILADTEFITERDLACGMTHQGHAASSMSCARPEASAVERCRIVDALRQTRGNKMSAARILGLSRRALYRRLARYGLDVH